jgi:hypothetical protein
MSRDAWQFRVETRMWLQCTRNAFLLQKVFARGKARTKSAAVNGVALFLGISCGDPGDRLFAAVHESGSGTKQEDIAVQQVVRY